MLAKPIFICRAKILYRSCFISIAALKPLKKKKSYFNISKNYFIYFNIPLNNTPYISSSILTFNILNNTSL